MSDLVMDERRVLAPLLRRSFIALALLFLQCLVFLHHQVRLMSVARGSFECVPR